MLSVSISDHLPIVKQIKEIAFDFAKQHVIDTAKQVVEALEEERGYFQTVSITLVNNEEGSQTFIYDNLKYPVTFETDQSGNTIESSITPVPVGSLTQDDIDIIHRASIIGTMKSDLDINHSPKLLELFKFNEIDPNSIKEKYGKWFYYFNPTNKEKVFERVMGGNE